MSFIRILLIGLFIPFLSFAQIQPKPVDSFTLGLWNFDNDQGDQVLDSGPNALNGTAYLTEYVDIPNIDPVFSKGRKFYSNSSFIDLGVVRGSILDFTGVGTFSVEAVIQLDKSASGNHIVFTTENTRLMVVNNQLAAYIRQPGGLFGVISKRKLSVGTSYRVGIHYKDQRVVLSINGKVDSSLSYEYPIAPPAEANSHAFIGGDIYARGFPGFIDDVIVKSSTGIDIVPPTINLRLPDAFQVTNPRPEFHFELSDDDSGVDPESIEIFLNGIPQTGISRSATDIAGFLDDDLLTSVLNDVRVIFSDNQGNRIEKSFFFAYSSIFHRSEYDTDSYTLGLWHFNEHSSGEGFDSSGNARHAFGDPALFTVGEGVFSNGRFFRGTPLLFNSIRFNDKFSFEGWFRPAGTNTSEVIFSNGQIRILRIDRGFIRVILNTTDGEKSYTSNESLLPNGELHHLAITWDGTKKNANLVFYIDGGVRYSLDAIFLCDFKYTPEVGIIGDNYTGMVDEVRFSSVIRTSFSIPVLDNQAITFLNLKNGESVNDAYPVFNANLNANTTIDIETMSVQLNGQEQVGNGLLQVSETGITGKFSSPLKEGLNRLDVAFKDVNGNLRKKSQYFYYIALNGSFEYEADENTLGLWHFNDLSDGIAENSVGDAHFINLTANHVVSGHIGGGVKGNTSLNKPIELNCRSFTVEGFFKNESQYNYLTNLFSLNSSRLSQNLDLNTQTGSVKFLMTSSSHRVDSNLHQAVPVDSSYHHFAIVYDSSRSFSQILLLIDGKVLGSYDFHNSCDYNNPITFALNGSYYVSFDEIRISDVARYSFNIASEPSDRPEILLPEVSPKMTFKDGIETIQIEVSDADGIREDSVRVFLNGEEFPVNKTEGIAPNISLIYESELHFSPGINKIEVHAMDMKNNESVKNLEVFYFQQIASSEYVSSESTFALFHFDEETGNAQDSSANGFELITTAKASTEDSVFNRAIKFNYGRGQFSFPPRDFISGMTIEFWAKGDFSYSTPIIFGNNSTINGDGSQNISINIYGIGSNVALDRKFSQTEFHHYALVIAPKEFGHELYFLIDGEVVLFRNKLNLSLGLNGVSNFTVGQNVKEGTFDELRWSTIPLYEFVSTKN